MSKPKSSWSRRGLSLLTVLAFASSSVAMAAPAVVTKNTEARTAPFAVAPVVGSLFGGDKVEADDTASNGWRRVKLPGGKSGYVLDADLNVDLSKVKPAAPPPDPAPPSIFAAPAETSAAGSAPGEAAPVQPLAGRAAPGRVPQYVGDFDHLAEVVKPDPQVFDLAQGLATRDTVSSLAIWGGVFGGILLIALSDTALAKKECAPIGDECVTFRNDLVWNIGLDLLILGPLVGWAVRPTRDDKTRVVNAWNTAHPDRPFIDRAGIEVP